MKTKILSALLLLTAFYSFSQVSERLKSSTQKFYEANYFMDFETLASLSHPEMLKTFGKDAFIEKLDKYYGNEEYRLREQLEMLPFQYSSIKKIGEISFCIITFRNPMRYFFEAKLSAETGAEKVSWLKQINKTKDVTFEPKRNSFNVKKMTIYVAVLDETTNNEWKFFNLDDPDQLAAFQTIFSESTKKELGL